MGALRVVRSAISPESVESLERDLANLNAKGAALADEIERLAAMESDLETGAEVGAAVNETRAARNRLRKLEVRIAETRDRLTAAKNAARARLLRDLTAEYGTAARAFAAMAPKVQESLHRAVAAREALQSHGFRVEYQSLPVPPAINGSAFLAPDLIEAFAAALDHRRINPSPQPPAILRTAADVQPQTGAGPLPRVTTWVGPESQARPALPRPPRRETAAEGERLVFLLRGSIDHVRKGRLQAGDVVSMTMAEAEPLLRAAAADFLTPEDAVRLGVAPAQPEAAE